MSASLTTPATDPAPPASIPEVTHHHAEVNGTTLHHVRAGAVGSAVLLVHGFPETWWAFHRLIPLLAQHHRVIAVDLRGFGDSGNDDDDGPDAYDSATSAEDLHALVEHLGLGPVHVVGQDISGAAVFRFASRHRADVLSFTGIEMGLAGFGLERLADVTRGGAWHIGVLAAPGIPEMLLAGREREFLGDFVFPAMTAVPGSVTDADVAEFTRTYSRPGGFRGASGLYRSMLAEGAEITALAAAHPLTAPVLAVGAGGGGFTEATLSAAVGVGVRSVLLEGVGHYAAVEAPGEVAAALLPFFRDVDAR
ncbi:alpha/beta fold hydrolase [Kineococcus radiotolerans]|uniref:Alpha/beta hydrolase fold n=1 Tax=Kineococcus radiotolerans (strain ATCC BAA-149 / DSM 14245 / SRS30216) TaxID=266940 RepID=A6W9W5_KINRD|nr:alpha/beta hydrolase [Kineococcus radiotolerans]ABS03604.1 alpha/beta hydrolase fold [Kineococcus radiotolerans SRS30216 = ATCC BAA-149]